MTNISEITTKLKRGDIRDIASATGFSVRYVGYVLNPNDDRTNELIVKAANLIISNRAKFSNKLAK